MTLPGIHTPIRPFVQNDRMMRYAGVLGAFWAPTSTISEPSIYLGVGLVVVVVILLFFWRRGQKKEALDIPPLEKPAFIQALFSVAADRNSRMDIVCSQRGNTLAPLHGVCIDQENKAIVRMVLRNTVVPSAWKNAAVNVFFNLTTRSTRTFYQFSSTVLDIHQQDRDCVLDLACPTALTNNQRREFVRVNPGAGMVEALTLWPYAPNIPLPEIVTTLGRPDFAFRPPKLAQIALMDISAGGALLRLAASRLAELEKKHAIGERYIMLMMLDSLKDGGSTMFWLCGVCRRTHVPKDTQHMELGLQFTHWSAPTALAAPINWQPVETDGEVPPLLRWTGRANILLNRKIE